ncbi:hypothetical protein FACS1894127_7660 [Clostridia bacterium]|nr:hypothetical protein FACS1894127_7660 [Clostridia bacterium]
MTYKPSGGIFAFTVIIVSFTLLYFRASNTRQNKQSLPILSLLIITSAYFLIFDCTYIQIFVFIFLCSLYLYWVALCTGTRLSDRLSGLIIFDLLNQWFITPFANFIAFFKAIRSAMSNKKNGKNVLLALLGIVIFLPILVPVVTLLTNADDSFQSLWNNITNMLNISNYTEHILRFILGIPVAAYLYGSLFGNVRKHNSDRLTEKGITLGILAMRRIPGAIIYAPIALFNCIYVLFFAALGSYLFSAMSGVLPETLTYAEYARKGFFELCAVAAINLCLLAVVYALLKRDGQKAPLTLRLLMGLMSLQTILLIITAMSKMFLYISSYGLTRLRIHTTWFMALLLIIFLLILVWHTRNYNLAKPMILVCAFSMLVLAFGNGDGIIAKYNLNQYEKGNFKTIDYVTLVQLSDAAMPHIYESYNNSSDPLVKENLYRVMNLMGRDMYFMESTATDPSFFVYEDIEGSGSYWSPESYRSAKEIMAKIGFIRWNIQSYKANRIRASLFP